MYKAESKGFKESLLLSGGRKASARHNIADA